MTFAVNLRRALGATHSASASALLKSQLNPIRLNSTLTSPRLFICSLSRNTTDETLKNAFNPFGQLVEAKVIFDRPTGMSKRFGFVRYSKIEEAERARQMMNGKFLDGLIIFVDPAKPREPSDMEEY